MWGLTSYGQPSSALADSLYQEGEYALAQAQYEKLVAYWTHEGETDSSQMFTLKVAKCDIQAKNSEAGRSTLQTLLAESPPLIPLLKAEALLEIGHSWLDQFDIREATTWVQKSLDFQQEINHPDTILWAKALDMRAILHLFSDEGKQAAKSITHAHKLRQQVLAPTNLELGYSANTLYMIQSAQGNLSAADTAIRQAWEVLGTQLAEDHPHRAVLANNLSAHLADRGDPSGAIRYLLEAISTNQKGERMESLVENYLNLCYVYDKIEDWDTALSYALKAQALAKTTFPFPHKNQANIQDALGSVYMSMGQFAKADTYFREAMAQRKQLQTESNLDLAQSMFNLGYIGLELENYEKARTWLTQSADIRAALLGTDAPKWADALGELAKLDKREGLVEAAILKWEKCLLVYEKAFGMRHPHTQETYRLLAECWRAKGNSDREAYYLDKSWEGLKADAGSHEIGLRNYPREVMAWANLQLNVWLQDTANQASFDWEIAEKRMRATLDWIPLGSSVYHYRARDGQSDSSFQVFYQKLALLSHKAIQHATPNLENWQDMLLACVQGVRGSQIRSALRKRQVSMQTAIPDSLVEQEQRLEAQIRFLRKREEGPSPLTAQLLLEWTHLQQQLQQTFPQYYEARFADLTPSLNAIQAQLNDESIVAYLDLDSMLLRVYIDAERMQSDLISPALSWKEQVQRYSQLLRQPGTSLEKLGETGYALYQILWNSGQKPTSPSVRILPDGPLYALNFELLPTDKFAQQFLIHAHTLYYAHSLIPSHGNMPHGRRTHVLGIAPGFTPTLKEGYLTQLEAGESPDSVFMDWSRTPWSLDWVRSLETQNWGISLTEGDATEAAFWARASTADVLHFGTHARLYKRDPLMSYLALTPDPVQGEDGYLRTQDLYGSSLNARMAVLTACETGAGLYLPGEGVLSLAHAFAYAGCPTVVYSLWPIDDEQTQVVVQAFYASLRKGASPAEALRQAKLTYLEQAPQSLHSPFYWGGLVLSGYSPPKGVGIGDILLWALLCVGLAIGGFFLSFWRKKSRLADDLPPESSIDA